MVETGNWRDWEFDEWRLVGDIENPDPVWVRGNKHLAVFEEEVAVGEGDAERMEMRWCVGDNSRAICDSKAEAFEYAFELMDSGRPISNMV
jgi:hypothetical protein